MKFSIPIAIGAILGRSANPMTGASSGPGNPVPGAPIGTTTGKDGTTIIEYAPITKTVHLHTTSTITEFSTHQPSVTVTVVEDREFVEPLIIPFISRSISTQVVTVHRPEPTPVLHERLYGCRWKDKILFGASYWIKGNNYWLNETFQDQQLPWKIKSNLDSCSIKSFHWHPFLKGPDRDGYEWMIDGEMNGNMGTRECVESAIKKAGIIGASCNGGPKRSAPCLIEHQNDLLPVPAGLEKCVKS